MSLSEVNKRIPVAATVFIFFFVIVSIVIPSYCISRDRAEQGAHEKQTDADLLNFLSTGKAPIVLLGASQEGTYRWMIMLKDAAGVIRIFDNSPLTRLIASRKPGDVITFP